MKTGFSRFVYKHEKLFEIKFDSSWLQHVQLNPRINILINGTDTKMYKHQNLISYNPIFL